MMAEALVIAIAILLASAMLADQTLSRGSGYQPRDDGRPLGKPPTGGSGGTGGNASRFE